MHADDSTVASARATDTGTRAIIPHIIPVALTECHAIKQVLPVGAPIPCTTMVMGSKTSKYGADRVYIVR